MNTLNKSQALVICIFALVLSPSENRLIGATAIVADSVKEFSTTQGQNRWRYGYMVGAYSKNGFQEFTERFSCCGYGDAWASTEFVWTSLWQYGGSPNGLNGNLGRKRILHLAVRRWVSSITGPVKIKGQISDCLGPGLACDGGSTIVGIYIDGVNVFSRSSNVSDYSVDATLQVGAAVDFTIDSGGNDVNDGTTFTAQIEAQTEPSVDPLSAISFQGLLNGTNGLPISDGLHNLVFRLYVSASATEALAQIHSGGVKTIGGVASLSLSAQPSWFGKNPARFLGVSIDGDQELTPRVPITAVPYSFRAKTVGDDSGRLFVEKEVYARSGDVKHPPFSVLADDNASSPAPNWIRTGVDAQFLWAVGSPWFPSVGMGFVVGDQVESTVVSVRKQWNRSAFQVRAAEDGESPLGPNSEAWMTVRNAGVGIFTPDPQSALDVNGTTRTKILQITGGADVAEHLDVEDRNGNDEFKIEPGMAVSINPGGNRKFMLSEKPYDRRRVGIISGGNGVEPGLILHDKSNPFADGEHPIAISGQVWCHADASYGTITPGDLLTTSPTPGHVMRASDDNRARFAVLGLALTGLKEGRGWVQLLVGNQ